MISFCCRAAAGLQEDGAKCKMADGQTTWSLSQQERDATVERIANNISTIAFFEGLDISDDAARTAATTAEKKAYNAALVAARTTTGSRPAAETTSAYARYGAEARAPSTPGAKARQVVGHRMLQVHSQA